MLKSNVVASLPDRELREQQIEEARRLAAAETERAGARRGTLHVSRSKSIMPKKSVGPKGHEAFLKALEASGAEIRLEKCDGSIVTGIVIHSDKYTISIRTWKEAPTLDADRIRVDRVIFKHDISEFSVITPNPDVPDSRTPEGHAI